MSYTAGSPGSGTFTTSALNNAGTSNVVNITAIAFSSTPECTSLVSASTAVFTTNAIPAVANFSASGMTTCAGSGAVVTISSNTLITGNYSVTYNVSGTNTVSSTTVTMSFTAGSPGSGIFTTSALNNAGASNVVNISAIAFSSTPMCTSSVSASTAAFTTNAIPAVSNFSASAATICAGNGAVVTVNSNTLTTGNYTVTYNVSGTNTVSPTTVAMSYTAGSPGSGTFTTSLLNNAGASNVVNITAIAFSSTPTCPSSVSASTAIFATNALPTPSISGLQEVCVSSTGNVYSTASVSGHTYSWDISGGTITAGSGTNSITVTWGTGAAGWVKVTETDESLPTNCTVTTAQYDVTINPLPTPIITGLEEVCASSTGNVYSTASVPGHTYSWSIDGGTITAGSGTNSITVTWGAAGTGTIDVTETITATSCSAAATQKSVTINALPTPSITGATTVCAGTTGSIYSVINETGHTYSWTVAGGIITGGAGTNSITVTWGAAGPGTVNVTETITATGCLAAATQKSVTINALPTPSITGAATVCAGTTGSIYSVINETGHTYSWTVAGGIITGGAGTNSITVTWGAAGTGTVDVTETITATSCSAAATQRSVTINALPTPNITGADAVCAGVTGSIYSVANVTGHTYSWTVAGGTITDGSGTNSITVTWGAAGPGIVDVTETITATSCSAAATQKSVTINALPTPSITGAATVCAEVTGSVYSVINETGHTYSWTVAGGTITGGAGTNSITVTWGAAGSGTVDVTETITATGCSAAATQKSVTINPLQPVNVSIVASANPVCSGTPVTFTATPTNGGTTPVYQWKVNGTDAGTNSSTYTYTPANNDAIICVLTSNETCASGNPATSNTETMTVSINLPVSVFIAPSANPVCSGIPVTFTATPTNGGTAPAYQWKVNGTNAGINSPTYTYTPNNGDAIICVLTSNETCATGNPATSNAVTITVNSLPTPSISGLIEVCETSTGNIYSTASISGHTYNWTISGGTITAGSGTNSITVTWGTTGAGWVQVTETITATSCAVTTPQYGVTITPTVGTPTAITISAGTEPSCQLTNGTTTTTYATTATNNTGFNWSLSNGSAGSIGASTGVMIWANGFSGTVNIQVTANGCNGPSAQVIRTVTITPTVGTPTAITVSAGIEPTCQLTNGTTTTTYATTATNNTGFNWSLSNGSSGSINASTGVMIWANGFSGTVDIQVTANGCNGPSTQVIRTVTVTPTVGTPTAITVSAGTEPICQLTNGTTTTTYATTATNNTGFNWSLSNGLAGSIGATTGVMTWANGFSGTVNIQVTANGCNGPSSQVIRTVTVTPTVGTPTAITISSGTEPTCQLTNGTTTTTYATTATNNTGFNWSLSNGSAGSIGAASGIMTWANGFSGTVNIQVTANGCNGPSAQVIRTVTIYALPNTSAITGNTTPACNGAGYTYSVTLTTGSNYAWTVPAGATITAGATGPGNNQITVTFGSTNGDVTVTETNAASCVGSTRTLTISLAGCGLNADFTGTPLTICQGSMVTFTNTSTGTTGSTTYSWILVPGLPRQLQIRSVLMWLLTVQVDQKQFR